MSRLCGWSQGKYGLSWQVVPSVLNTYLQDPDKTKAARVMQALMTMAKLDIAELQTAYE